MIRFNSGPLALQDKLKWHSPRKRVVCVAHLYQALRASDVTLCDWDCFRDIGILAELATQAVEFNVIGPAFVTLTKPNRKGCGLMDNLVKAIACDYTRRWSGVSQ